jgi:MFS family permease
VYPSIRSPEPSGEQPALRPRSFLGIGRNVLAIGMTSLVTDVSSEMVNAVIPLYLVFQLHMSPLAFGVFNGAFLGIAGVVRITSGVVSDRRRDYKVVAGAGYAVSAAAKVGLLAAGTAAVPASAAVFADRAGKGLRTSPRDALISLSAPAHRLAEAFGVHRALDTTGALLGPLVAYLILDRRPRDYEAVFVISLLVAIVGLGVWVCFVQNRAPAADDDGARLTRARAMRLLRDPGFRRLVIVGGLLGVATIGDAFVYLVLQRRSDFSTAYFPLLYVGTASTYLLFAVPLGRLADRVGRARVFLGGYVVLAVVYLLLLPATVGPAVVLLALALNGVFYAATDGILMAMASTATPSGLRTTGIAVLTTVSALTAFVASTLFGAWWDAHGPTPAVQLFVTMLAVAGIASAFLLRPRRVHDATPDALVP